MVTQPRCLIMMTMMQHFTASYERVKFSSLQYHVGIWLLILCTGFGGSTVKAEWQHGLRLAQDTPPNQQAQTESPTPEEAHNPADQQSPDGERRQVGTGSEAPQTSAVEQEDAVLAGIQTHLGNVSVPDLGALGQAFGTSVKKQDEASSESSAVELIELGDLDGDGVSEVAVKLQITEASQQDTEGQASPPSSRGLYLLSWDGTRWEASRLAASAENLQFKVVRLGKSTGRGIAVVNVMGEEVVPYPAIFQLREHEAALLWDSRGGDDRYTGLAQGQIEFRDDAKLDQTDMIVSGRADPGLLEFERGGQRGFREKCVYHWDGQAYVPSQTEYAGGPDYTLYRFIAALHLHDFRTAYTLIDPGKFLRTDAPSLEKLRKVVEETWPEFLDDQVFQAREAKAGSLDALAFELPEKHYIYRPTLSDDGRFLLTGLERKVEMPTGDSSQASP